MAEILPGVVRMGMIKRLDGLTPDEFRDHWKGPHGAIAAKIPNLRRYHQNHVIDSFRLRDWPDRWLLDGLSELWFDDIAMMLKSVASPGYAPLARDTPTVMTMPGLIAGVQEPKMRGAQDGAKAMIVLGRLPSVSAEDFASAWRKTSANFRALEGALGVADIYVNHWESEPTRTIPYDALPVDIVCELWFATPAERRAALSGALASQIGDDMVSLVANASCYAMQTYVIVP
jgi:uncharacterized protein (TIGR02118 family)